jgi:hypothetical protein
VCKLWDTQAKAHLAKRIEFKLTKSNTKNVLEFEKLTKTSFHGFLKLHVDFVEWNNYHRYLETIDRIVAESGSQLKEFFFRFNVNSSWRIQDFREKYLANLSNIEDLSLSTVPSHFFEVSSIFPPGSRQMFNSLETMWINRTCTPRSTEIGFWTDLFLCAPNLVKLELNGKTDKDAVTATNFTDAINVISEIKPGNTIHHYISVNFTT